MFQGSGCLKAYTQQVHTSPLAGGPQLTMQGGKISWWWPLINCDLSDSHLQVSSHFVRLFSEPSSPEQCSHNAVVLVEALRYVGLDYDCQVRKGEHLQ